MLYNSNCLALFVFLMTQHLFAVYCTNSRFKLAYGVSVLSLTENTLKLSLPSRASEVIYDSEVHFVSEVSPNGEVMGKLNFTEHNF